jgi:hypothetical protein
MAIIKMTSSKASVGKLENYLKDNEKTKEHLQMGLNCDIRHLSYEFKDTMNMHQKNGGRRYYHVIQSFSAKDNVSPEKAHEIGVKLADVQFGQKGYEVGVITHIDKNHVHNHLVLNSVNALTGKKFKSKARDLWRVKDYSNELCKDYQLEHSLVNHYESKGLSYNRGEYESLKRGNSWKAEIIKDIKDIFLKASVGAVSDMKDFITEMEKRKYKVDYKHSRKTITFTTPGGKKVRGKTLTKSYEDLDYSKGALENEIKRYREISIEKGKNKDFEQQRTYGSTSRESKLEPTDEKLYHRTNGQKYDKKNELAKGTNRHQRSIDKGTKTDAFDFEKARKHVKSERNSTKKDFGKWTDELEKEHEQGLNGNAIDRERTLQRNRELEKSKQRKFELDRTKNIGPNL